MRVEGDTLWVVPFLDDVAQFLSEHGRPVSSSIMAEAAAKVQCCSAEMDQQQGGPAITRTTAEVVAFSLRPPARR